MDEGSKHGSQYLSIKANTHPVHVPKFSPSSSSMDAYNVNTLASLSELFPIFSQYATSCAHNCQLFNFLRR